MRLGVGLVAAMGILALISSGVVEGLGDRVGSAFSSSSSASGQQRAVSADVSGRAYVLDGDTIEVGGVRVRLEGLHCPEAGEPVGSAATNAMRGLTGGQNVSCSLTGERSYDRMIGTCYVCDADLTAAIISEGVCARCPRYDPGGRYVPAQREAGAWRGSMPGYC
jgi:endonuclease YncB( thermonuclease family)